MTQRFWLMKSEPDAFSIDDLRRRKNQSEHWDGVRNYQARNFMMQMQVGDGVLFYHSNADPPHVAGTAVVCRAAYPDHTQFDPNSKYFDAKASPDKPRWFMVDVRYESTFAQPLSLATLRETPGLEGLELLRRGSRLSVQPVSPEHFKLLRKLGKPIRAAHAE